MSEVKVNKLTPRTNCGTVTLGDSGDSFTIPSGVTITNNGTAAGFGATGAASWDTTVKTSGFTAVSGVGYFVNTTGGAISVNLPAGSAGDVVAFKDYAGTFDTNALTLVQNGSDKIGGSTVNAALGTEGQAVTLVFIDSTQGWLVTDSGLQTDAPTAEYITATGGTITTCGNFKIHTFTGPGTFTVCSAGNPSGSDTVSYAVVAGGGGGGSSIPGNAAAGGGAGGYRESKAASDSYTASPLNATCGPGYNLPVSAQGYPITVGAAGSGSTCESNKGGSGGTSTFSTISSAGGGGGGSNASRPGVNGGSGGGGAGGSFNQPGGTGNTPPVSPAQGTNGGNSTPGSSPPDQSAGGGGGATEIGVNGGSPGSQPSGRGGVGATTNITGSPVAYAGGGGGGGGPGLAAGAASPCGTGGAGGTSSASTGATNKGGGGGGSGTGNGANGGSGVVIIRYKFQ